MKMNSYYFKIDTPVGVRYCEFDGRTKEVAINRALLCCFSSYEEEFIGCNFKKEYPTLIKRISVLSHKYLSKIEDCTKEEFELNDPNQND